MRKTPPIRTHFAALLAASALLTSGCATLEVTQSMAPAHYEFDKQHQEEHEVPGNPLAYALLPLSVPLDIATSPFQFVYIMMNGIAAKAPDPPTIHGAWKGSTYVITSTDTSNKKTQEIWFRPDAGYPWALYGPLLDQQERPFPPQYAHRKLLIRGVFRPVKRTVQSNYPGGAFITRTEDIEDLGHAK